MFSYIQGKVVEVGQQAIVIEKDGFGFSLAIARPEAYHKNQNAKVSIYMHWNQEQGPTLYGFQTDLEKQVFLLITSCSGIGPKIGIAVLKQLAPSDFLAAVQEGDAKALSQVNGIGPKKAEQMVLQLRDKVAKLVESGITETVQGAKSLEDWKNVTQVLQSLNYSRPEIDAALAHLRKELGGKSSSFDELVRHSLSFLAKRV